MLDGVVLRDVVEGDLPTFFEQQRDPAATHMAAFTAEDPGDRAAFDAHRARKSSDDSIRIRTILLDGRVARSVASFVMDDMREVAFWIGREFRGRGAASRALSELLVIEKVWPLYARVARDNVGSIRVLERCGFAMSGEGEWFSNARGREIDEVLLRMG